MKNTIKKITGCIVATTLIVFVLAKSTDILEKKSSDYKYIPFFEHAEDIDVLFLGTSHMLNAVYPMELYNDYGITSYNFGGHANSLATTYWVMENALDYCKPKVVVIDCMQLVQNTKTSENFEYVHISLDAFPLSMTKVKATLDLLNDYEYEKRLEEGEQNKKHTAMELLWNYSVYHSRWADLTREDFIHDYTNEYGAESRIQIMQPGEIVENPGTIMESETIAMQYLQRMIECCREKGIKVLLTYLPYPMTSVSAWTDLNTADKIAGQHDVDYINLLKENIVDFQTDCYDMNSHLNPAGAWKVTDYLGQYLTDHFDLEDHRGDTHYSYWDEDYITYEEMKLNRLKKVDDLNTYLMLLEDKAYGYILNVGDATIFHDETTINLLKNKGVDINDIDYNTKYIFVCGEECIVVNKELSNGLIDSSKKTRVYFNDGKQYGLYKGDQEIVVGNEDDLKPEEGQIKVCVFDLNHSRDMLHISKFAIAEVSHNEYRNPDEKGQVILTSNATRVASDE